MVEQRGIQTESFDGFSVLVLGDQTMTCARYVPDLSVTMGTYTLTYHFFVVDIPDTNIILGVEWLITLGKVMMDWKTLEMEWDGEKKGRHEKIRGTTYVSASDCFHSLDGGSLPERRHRVGSRTACIGGRDYRADSAPGDTIHP